MMYCTDYLCFTGYLDTDEAYHRCAEPYPHSGKHKCVCGYEWDMVQESELEHQCIENAIRERIERKHGCQE